ncbi:zinc finger BED domain-containing protein RICESLEEPER 2-like [Apium graveolens]|uniref:zinc finger BED domain-containing protein RICESLEEPER 2-like n=1 Tax=Apium graveolens TaxID=4045 RepID=UPI003D7B7867
MVCELPFMHVEQFMFNEVIKTTNPFCKKITRGTLKNDCKTTYEIEKQKLKEKFSPANRVNFTTDCWTSNQKIGYMVVTGHWIDEEWKLNSRIFNFVNVPPPHSGHVLAEVLFSCFGQWGIEDKTGTITVDNEKANDEEIKNLKESFSIRKPLRLGGNIFHVRCCAHILNLCVRYGLETIQPIIDSIRDDIKYVAASEARELKFTEITKQLKLQFIEIYRNYT